MKIFYLFISLLFLYGCSDNNTQENRQAVFNISLSPALSGSFPTLIPINSQMVVYTTEPLDYSTVNAQNVYIHNKSNNTRVPSNVKKLSTTTGQAIAIKPLVYLQPGNDYDLVVTTDVATETGAHRNADAIISFTTGSQLDTTPPTLISTLPKAGTQQYVESYAVISFQFSEPLSPIAAENIQIKIKEQGPTTAPSIEGRLHLSGSLLSFVPDENLSYGAYYIAELNTTNIIDLAGNTYNGAPIETVDFNVNPAIDAKPISSFNGVKDYNLSLEINTLISSQNELFVGSANGLDIFTFDNAATPTKLVHRSHLENIDLGSVYSIALDNATQRAYLGTSTGFTVVDITDLNRTSIISHLETLNTNGYYVPVYGLSFDQDHLYLAASSLGVIDVNISDITAPTILQSKSTQAPAFDISIINGTDLALSSYGNGLSTLNRSTLTETNLSQSAIYSHNMFKRLSVSLNDNFFYSAGTEGVGNAEDTGTSFIFNFIQTEAYVTRITDRSGSAVAIMKDLGLGFFSDTGTISRYESLPFTPTAMTFLENTTPLGNLLILSDRSGQIYLEVVQ